MEKDKLNWWQDLVVLYWFIYNPLRYDEYTYLLGYGLRREYAFEIVKNMDL